MLQLHEIKSMLAETTKAKAKRRRHEDDKSTGVRSGSSLRTQKAVGGTGTTRKKPSDATEMPTAVDASAEPQAEPGFMNAAFAVYAQMLVELRAQHSAMWGLLRSEEENLSVAVSEDRKKVSAGKW
jgi:hypothetical protein